MGGSVLVFRWIVMLLLLASVLCIAMSIATGQPVWRRRGLVILKWTLIAALAFFAVIILERMAIAI
jgi:hypothetical protein